MVRVGQVWQDLDTRMDGRQCIVTHVHLPSNFATKAYARMRRIDRKPGARVVETTVRIDRMHKGATGWALLSEPAA